MHELIAMESEGEWDDLFADLDPIDPFEVKKDEVAAELAALLSLSKMSRAGIAEELNWPKSRVTRVLSGKSNLTLQTIWEFVSKLDYDFDIVYRKPTSCRSVQPWHSSNVNVSTSSVRSTNSAYVLHVQSASEVEFDFQCGRNKSVYVSFLSKSDSENEDVVTLSPYISPRGLQSHEATLFKIDLKKGRGGAAEILNIKGDSDGSR